MCSHCGEKFSRYRTRCSADGQKVIEDLRGQTFGGRYRVRELVGVGGMDSTVWKAWQTGTERVVALKVLPVAEEAAAKRFARGARIAANLNHPHCTVVHDYGRTEDGKLFLVMEFLSGQVLQAMLGPEGMSARDTMHIADQVLQALEHAHAERAVHRDLKPDNLFLTRRNDDPLHVKILDFGIAKYVEEDPEHTISQEEVDADVDGFEDLVTEQRQVCGTPQYMAPEQIVGAKVDGRTDLYSLACVMYRMLTGRLPFEGKSRYELYQMHVKSAPRSFADVRPDLSFPPGLEAVIMRALMKRPDSRFSSASEMRRALEAVSAEPAPSPVSRPPTSRAIPVHPGAARHANAAPRSVNLPIDGSDATILPEDFDPYSDTRQPRGSQVVPVRPVPVRPAQPSLVARPVVGRPPTIQAPAIAPPSSDQIAPPPVAPGHPQIGPGARGVMSKGSLPMPHQAGVALSSNEVVPPRSLSPEPARPVEPRRASLLNAPVVRHASKSSIAVPATRAGMTQVGDWNKAPKKKAWLPILVVGIAFTLGVGGVAAFKAFKPGETATAEAAAPSTAQAILTEEQGRRHGQALLKTPFIPGEEWVTIRTVPSGAEVYINGVSKGKTPFRHGFGPGNHQVELKLDGYEPHTLPLEVNPSVTGRLSPEQIPLVPLAPAEPLPGQPTTDGAEGTALPAQVAPSEPTPAQPARPQRQRQRPSSLQALTEEPAYRPPEPKPKPPSDPAPPSGGGSKSSGGVRLLDDVPTPAPSRPKVNLLDE